MNRNQWLVAAQSIQSMFLTLKKSLQVDDFVFPFGSSLASEASYVFLSCPKTRKSLSQQGVASKFERNNFEVEQKGFHLALKHILSLKIMLEGNFSEHKILLCNKSSWTLLVVVVVAEKLMSW